MGTTCRTRLAVDEDWTSIGPDGGAVVLLADGWVEAAQREFALALPPGSVLVVDPRDPLCVRAHPWGESQGAASVLVLRFPNAWHPGPAREGDLRSRLLRPMMYDPDSAAARALQPLSQAPLPAPQSHEWEGCTELRDFLAAQEALGALVARCAGQSFERRLAQFLRLSQARAVLAWGHADSLDVASVAGISRLSPVYFMHLFRRVFEASANGYRIERRMHLAQTLLTQTSMPIAEIVHHLGLVSHSTFARDFRKRFGCTASSIRGETRSAA